MQEVTHGYLTQICDYGILQVQLAPNKNWIELGSLVATKKNACYPKTLILCDFNRLKLIVRCSFALSALIVVPCLEGENVLLLVLISCVTVLNSPYTLREGLVL